MPSTVEWTLAIISNVVHFSFIITIIYSCIKFYKFSHFQALQKRSPLLVYLMNICFIFYLIQHCTYKIAYIHGEENFDFDPILRRKDIGHENILSLTSSVCYVFSLHGMLIMLISRSWLIYFNTQYALQSQVKFPDYSFTISYLDTFVHCYFNILVQNSNMSNMKQYTEK